MQRLKCVSFKSKVSVTCNFKYVSSSTLCTIFVAILFNTFFFTQAMFTSYRIGLLRFGKLHSMMWTHFPFDIYVGYDFKNFKHYFNVFSWKKHPFEKKKTRGGTAIAITKECRKYEKLIWFWVMMKYSFSIHGLIQILVVIVVGPHY